MRLIMLYENTDGYTYSFDCTTPIEYDSEEALAVDFEDAIKKAFSRGDSRLIFCGIEFQVTNFFEVYSMNPTYDYIEPTIKTLDGWFEDEIKLYKAVPNG